MLLYFLAAALLEFLSLLCAISYGQLKPLISFSDDAWRFAAFIFIAVY